MLTLFVSTVRLRFSIKKKKTIRLLVSYFYLRWLERHSFRIDFAFFLFFEASGGRTVHRSPSPGQNGVSENANQEQLVGKFVFVVKACAVVYVCHFHFCLLAGNKAAEPSWWISHRPCSSYSSTENTQPETKNINNSE